MVSNLLWAGGYLTGTTPTTALSTELNALANGSNTAAGTAINNGTGDKAIYADFQFLAGGTFSPVANGSISVWLLRTIDGTNYEDGSATVTPGRRPDLIIPVYAGTTITPRVMKPMAILPPGLFKPLAQNNTGVALPATSNVISFATYAAAQ